ncbi:MAG: MBOAT family O-acyltransferase [Alphaproteobacteria bacterium]
MLFHTQLFLLVFLPLAYGAYAAAALLDRRFGPLPRKSVLIAASIIFYAYWDPRLAPLLIGSVMVNWLVARFAPADSRHAPLACIAVNLGLLALFKYADFFASNVSALFGADHAGWNIALPLGISFFTFQQISYLVDRMRGDAPRYGLADYALFVTFFPQLVAGPIVRHDEIIGQFARGPFAEGAAERCAVGLTLLAIGLVKKVFLADPLAEVVDPLFAAAGSGAALGFAEAWTAALGFALQIYFDFSGYSDMAIGLALLFGFRLPINFDAPYRAVSVADFWRRWHITLSRFLRDYVYIPLGGNRGGLARATRNTVATMLLSGLWHGAAWTFVAWGGLHGLALAAERVGQRAGIRVPAVAAWALTFLFVTLAFVVFRAQSFAEAAAVFAGLVGGNGFGFDYAYGGRTAVVAIALAVVLLFPTSQRFAAEKLQPSPFAAVATAAALLAVLLQVGVGANQEFIYFQF